MLHSAPSDRVKVVVSLCAIISSALTLAAYFGAIDAAARSLTGVRAGVVFDARTTIDPSLVPPSWCDMGAGPTASS